MKATDAWCSARGRARRLAALVLLAGLGLTAQAQTPVPATSLSGAPAYWAAQSGGGWVRVESALGSSAGARVWQTAVGGAATATDAVVLSGRAGALAVSTASGLSASNAAGAVARCLLGGGVICAVGTTAAVMYAAYRLQPPSAVPGSTVGAGLLDFDPGKTPDATCARWNASGAGFTEAVCSPQEWIDKQVAVYNANGGTTSNCPSGPVTVLYTGQVGTMDGSGAGYVYVIRPATPCTAQQTTASFYGYPTGTSVQRCAASIDALDPTYNVPAGGAIGPDGKCPTARYNHTGLTADQAAAKVVAFPPAASTYNPSTGAITGSQWGKAVADAIDKGGQASPMTPGTVTGPGSQTGPGTTTTTTPSGGGTPTTTTHTPTYNYTYSPTTINYTTTYTDVVTTGGTTTTTTYNEAAPTPQDPKDPCTANPTRAGCMDIGTAPTDAVPKLTSTLTYAEESVGLPSGCPAPNVIAGRSYSYAPICDAATNARPWVLVGAAFASLMLVIAALRSM